jgi:hypothetical protein
MIVTEHLDKAKRQLADAWLERLEREHVLMGQREATRSALERWLDYLGPTAEGDQSTAHELYKLVAFHARNLGAEGRPASAALMQIILLEDALKETLPDPPSAITGVVREMMRVVADAHALGSGERARSRHHLEIRDFSPVIRLQDKTILGFLLGAMESDLIDAMMGRLLRETARSGADVVVLDTFGAARDNELFHRTVHAFQRSEVGCRVTLVLTGLRDTEATKAALRATGCNMERIRFEPDVNSAIVQALHNP